MSNEPKFTPGPWMACGNMVTQPFVRAGRIEVADILTSGDSATADAHLIAAAPDLYEALQSAVFELDQDGRFNTDDFKTVLAKAEGKEVTK